MRAVAVLAAALLLTGCTWVQKEMPWSTPPAAPPAVPQAAVPAVPPKPTEPAPRPPRPKPHVERPAPQTPAAAPPEQTQQTQPQSAPALDYQARCHAMAANRASDARELGASAADQAKMQSDTYRDCLAQSK
jgi:outer membrane biosynthesis protein TonB